MLRRRWKRAEASVATLAEGRVQPGSGAPWHAKGDVKSAASLIQVKSTTRKSYSLTLRELHTIEQQALAADREPLLVIEFQTATGIERYVVRRYYGEEDV